MGWCDGLYCCSAVSPGQDDCSTVVVSPVSLNLGRRRGKVFGKEGRAAQAAGLEAAAGPWRPT